MFFGLYTHNDPVHCLGIQIHGKRSPSFGHLPCTSRPSESFPGTVTEISVRLSHWPAQNYNPPDFISSFFGSSIKLSCVPLPCRFRAKVLSNMVCLSYCTYCPRLTVAHGILSSSQAQIFLCNCIPSSLPALFMFFQCKRLIRPIKVDCSLL